MTSRPSTEQLLVQLLLRAMDEVLAVMEDEGAEDQERAEAELDLAFQPIWGRMSGLRLRCMSDGFWWGDVLVLGTDEARSSLVSTLVQAGIQSLAFQPGAERDDVRRFLQLVDRKARLDEAGELDLVMLLFEADLHHVGYSVTAPSEHEEDPADGAAAVRTGPVETSPLDTGPPPGVDPEEVRSAVREDVARTDTRGIVQVERFDSTLYFLDRREIEYLQREVEKQYERDHTRSVLALLLDTLQMRSDPEVRGQVVAALRTFLPYLLGSGRFSSLAYLTDELRTVVRETELDAPQRTALEDIRRSLSGKGTLRQLLLALEDGSVTPTVRSLGALLRQLDVPALETVLVWGGQLGRQEAKAALSGALQQLFREDPGRLGGILCSSDRAVLQRALLMAGQLRDSELVESVASALDHGDAATRKLAVRVLASTSGTPAMREVARALRDPDSSVRKEAYQAFLHRPYRSVAKRLRKTLESADLEALDLSERKLLFSAFGATAGAEGVSDLAPILAGKRTFGRRPSSETRACAVLGLEQIEGRAARSELEAAATSRDPLVRSAAMAALRSDR